MANLATVPLSQSADPTQRPDPRHPRLPWSNPGQETMLEWDALWLSSLASSLVPSPGWQQS